MIAENQKQLILASVAGVSLLSFLAYRKYSAVSAPKKTLLEQVGGEAAVDAAVELFYKKMLSDPRVKRFFEKTNMVHQKGKQRNFLMYVLDGGNRHKYKGLSMDFAHRKLIKNEGMTDFHFNATAENLDNTLKELGVADSVREEVMTAVESLREQVMCRGKWAIPETPKQTLFERLGGEAAVNAAVELFYKRMLADDRVSRFFKDTNMATQHKKQFSFMCYAFGAPTKYGGLAMDAAHRRLVEKEGMNDTHFDAVKENLDLTLGELGVAQALRDEVATALEGLREQVMCRGKWAIEKKSLYERIGGEAAVNAAVEKFYKRMLSDDRVSRFFKDTNMAKQHLKQVSFMSYALGAPKKYAGLAMDAAHRRLIEKEGMTDFHYDATCENLDLTLAELGVPKDLRLEVRVALESLREQVMCRGQWAINKSEPTDKRSLYERIGGEAAVNAAVEIFYKRMLSDDRVSRFFKDTNMAKQHLKQVSFMSYALGSPKKYAGLAMDKAHRRLVEKEGMTDFHYDATCENLDLTLAELGVPKDLRVEVRAALETLREQVMCRGKWAQES